uniref:Uncharacterized protein n=1 Tax=Megaselia scalaris TaxID=36166 RepID=T1GIH1_MEGSC
MKFLISVLVAVGLVISHTYAAISFGYDDDLSKYGPRSDHRGAGLSYNGIQYPVYEPNNRVYRSQRVLYNYNRFRRYH